MTERERGGGGVACYIHNSLKVKFLASSPSAFSNSPEFIILEIRSTDSRPLLFSSIYRRPKALLLNDFTFPFNQFSHSYQNIIIAGDLNCNLLRPSFEFCYLHDWTLSQSLHIVLSDATFHTASSDSLLDVFIIDCSHKLFSFAKSDCPFTAGHDLIELTYAFDNPNKGQRRLTREVFRVRVLQYLR